MLHKTVMKLDHTNRIALKRRLPSDAFVGRAIEVDLQGKWPAGAGEVADSVAIW